MFSILLKYSYNKYNFGKSLIDFETDNKNNQLYYLMHGKVINFKLSLEDEKKGQRYIDRLNIPKNKKWICVHNRDSYYLDKSPFKINYKISTSDYFKYHSYRDFDVNNLSKAVNLFNDQGYHVFRMGILQANKMNYKNKNFTDYAFNSDKSDFNDIFLLSNCSAYIGSDAGIMDVPFIFGKPIYIVNFSLSQINVFHQDGCSYSFKNNNSIIFKHLFDRKRQRKLSLKEMFKSNLFKAGRSEIFEKAGIDLIENTSEEIYDIANETLENLNDKKENINDYDQQKKFWDIYYDNTNFKRYEDIPAKICSKFLLKNPYILE
jgi:putative glycosyltransferase (TIGR04372 family)